MGDRGEKAVGGGEDGLWQLGASTSRWAVVNSRYQVRTGCYQTFKAESNRLLLQQGEKRWCSWDSLSARFHQSPLTESHKRPPSMILMRMWAILSPLHLSGALCIPQMVFWLEMKLSVSFKCSEQMQSDCKGCCFHPERVDVHMRTAYRRLCRAKSLQCLVLSTFLWSLLIFSPFFIYLSRSQVLSMCTVSW